MKSVRQIFDPFYDFARRKLNIPTKIVDEYLARNAVARINGKTVELTYTDPATQAPVTTVGHIGIGRSAHAARWVNQFNDRRGSR
jgi:hypothetical protein